MVRYIWTFAFCHFLPEIWVEIQGVRISNLEASNVNSDLENEFPGADLTRNTCLNSSKIFHKKFQNFGQGGPSP